MLNYEALIAEAEDYLSRRPYDDDLIQRLIDALRSSLGEAEKGVA